MADNKEFITVTFPTGLTKNISYKNKDGEEKSSMVIRFPYRSKYYGYEWFINPDWVRLSEYNEGFSFIGFKPDFEITIRKNVKDEETDKYVLEDEKIIKPEELKEEMRVL